MMTSTENHSSSTGHAMAASNWLDAHFRFAQPEYEAQARMVGIRPGWRVLDAGCGGGSFLPLLAELVGPGGMLTALDLAPENVSTVEALAANGALACPVEAHIGGVTALPFAGSVRTQYRVAKSRARRTKSGDRAGSSCLHERPTVYTWPQLSTRWGRLKRS
jgi:2-polyprenyl-3-methyl-5-hydroxy-6-metoxy-1,4-benzoquinol methylase